MDSTSSWSAAAAPKTEKIHAWMRALDDDSKMRFAINWRIPHSLFNVASRVYEGDPSDLQGIDWFKIFKSRDLGNWSHGGAVYVIDAREMEDE